MASCGFAQLVAGACTWTILENVKCVALGIYKTYIKGHLGDSLLDCEAKLFFARAGKPGGKAALGMFCIFIFNWVTIIVIVKFICGFALYKAYKI